MRIGSDQPKARQDLLYRELADGCALYDPVRDRVHVLNPVAGLIWTACDGEHTIEEIVGLVVDTVGAPPDVARQDVGGVIADFARLGLFE